jgi:tRNA (cmo5U34)-methyltransferase
MKTPDTLFATPRDHIVDFAFDASVASVFPDMIRRSVPGYGEIIALTGLLAERYAQPGSRCYDLGCSLGAASLSMRRRIPHADCSIVAVDNAPAMLEQARANLEQAPGIVPVELRCADVREVAIEDASVVVLNFTLQFLEPAERLPLLQRIHAGLRPGGILILSEKLMFANEQEQDFNTAMHLAFKRANGYSELEISQKRTALENVLIPDTREQHEERLRWAGFRRSECWFRCFNFASFVAFK